MAEQHGIIPLRGTIGKLNFYKSKDGYMARGKGGVSKERIATEESFQRTRENGAEFGRAGKAGKVLRTAFTALRQNASDSRMVSRLTREMMKVIQADATNDRGLRNVIDGEAGLLQGFEFNAQAPLSTTLFAPFESNVDRIAGTLEVTIPAFVPKNMVGSPAGATHFKLMSSGASIDFETPAYEVDVQSSAELPLTNEETAPIVLTNSISANSTHPLFLAFGVEFYQQVNNKMYPLKNGAFNCLCLVKAENV